MSLARALALGLVVGGTGCAPGELPPFGEAVVEVDTDLPVPLVASRLRVDTFADDGTWLDARDVALPDPRDWPASFSVQAADDVAPRRAILRLRVYGERVRDYRGARRVVQGGADVTPRAEPAPELAVDRLVAFDLVPGQRGRLRVVARGACAGVPSAIDPPARRTCVDEGRASELLEPSPLEPEAAPPTPTAAGTVARTPCPPATDPRRVCVEGGAFVLGTDDVSVVPDPALPLSPERVVRLSTFAIDRDEVTVGRYREGSRGFSPAEPPTANEGELGATPDAACTFSEAPRGRESYALTCLPWATARAWCQRQGGDLPTEAQWEYAATSAGRRGKVAFPWGDEAPRCGQAVYGRLTLAGFPGACEAKVGAGPLPVFTADAPTAPEDVSAAGVRGLAGGVSEWVRDVAAPYRAPCWDRPSVDPVCDGPVPNAHIVRGGGWAGPPINARSTARLGSTRATALVGFRCVYPVPR
jgi:formylglycine-generating enzyme required for sulfatase activity